MSAEGISTTEGTATKLFDVLIIGAGITGLYELQVLRRAGFSVRLVEAGSNVGGTWYWNRYPGCRLDSESYTYQFIFDEELLAETRWTERFATQPELETYVNRFADRFDLRRDIELDTRVQMMEWNDADRIWTVLSDDGRTYRSRFVVTATGILSAPHYPDVPGIDRYKGELYHTGTWPHDPVDFTGKRVAVIGTGASGVQIIPIVAESAAHLTVFQRTPNWAVPLHNAPISDDEMADIRGRYPEIFHRVQNTSNGFLHDWDPTSFFEVSEEQRLARFEELYATPGFAKWFGTYREIATTPEANAEYTAFMAEKIRSRVKDPDVAELLIPKDHPFGTKRVPCETNYFEAYNRDNVTLVPLDRTPILEYAETGLVTSEGLMEFDMIVLATGFDAFTGALMRIDIRGVDGLTLQEKWKHGPQTYLGIQVAGFPNLLINGGPHGKGGIGNSPRCSEPLIIWIGELLEHMRANGLTRIEADAIAEKSWTEQINNAAVGMMASKVRSYSFGDNVPGKPHVYYAFSGTLPDFAERLRTMIVEDLPGFHVC
jgi:cation diffusion facilitator CzcD-associated flavoprotein CzcO